MADYHSIAAATKTRTAMLERGCMPVRREEETLPKVGMAIDISRQPNLLRPSPSGMYGQPQEEDEGQPANETLWLPPRLAPLPGLPPACYRRPRTAISEK